MRVQIAEWYIRHKPKFIFIFFLAVVVIVTSLIVNLISLYSSSDDIEEGNITSLEETINNNFNSITMGLTDSVLSGDELTRTQITMAEVIEQFVEYCNTNNIEEAYNMISEECKEEVYTTLESFTNNYYNTVFNGIAKKVTVENWSRNIYKVDYTDDFLATGVYSESSTIQDYISVIENEDEEYRLNINGYISREEINKTAENDYISVTVLKSDTYMDYQTFTFRITNKTSYTILLDDNNYADSMYIEDANGIQYNAYSQELTEPELTFTKGETKEITVKYYNRYGTEKDITKIGFLRITPNFTTDNSVNYNNSQIKTLEIDID